MRELYPSALYTHCSSHVLNLAISSASELRAISNTLSTIGEVCSFFSRSAHRVQAMQRNIEKEVPNAKHHRLKLLCPTRWIDRNDSVIIFLALFPAIVKTLDDLQDSTTLVSDKARSILTCIEKSSFIVACALLKSLQDFFYHSPEYSKQKNLIYILSLLISRECRIRHLK